ncbi:MAG: hypothetical protein ACE5IR_10445 [bacterium]
MSDKPNNVISLDVETNVQTAEGRFFLNHLNTVSHVLFLRDSTVRFQGEQVMKTGYFDDFKSLILYKCPKGYFLFGDKAFGTNNLSWIGSDLDSLLKCVDDKKLTKKISEDVID